MGDILVYKGEIDGHQVVAHIGTWGLPSKLYTDGNFVDMGGDHRLNSTWNTLLSGSMSQSNGQRAIVEFQGKTKGFLELITAYWLMGGKSYYGKPKQSCVRMQ